MLKVKWRATMFCSLFLLIIISGCAKFNEITNIPTPQIASASKVLDSKGRIVANLYQENRVPVKLNQISPFLIKAVIATEDARFYQHKGIDLIGIARAVITNLKARKLVEGGSTITQQTAKNIYLSNERTWQRKLRELIITFQLEQKYTKDEILDMYLNQIYFGQGAYGVEVASQTYFGKSASKLNLAESALLAGLPKGPNIYSPFRHYSSAKERQKVVLNRMLELGQIKAAELKEAKEMPLVLTTSTKLKTIQAPYFVDEVRQYITEKYENGAELVLRGGLTVYTTLDLDLQKAAEETLKQGLSAAGKDLEGALVAIEPQTGYIKAMVGGKDYQKSKYNRVYAQRQPGSAFKPFLYAAAIEKGLTAGTVITCEPIVFNLGNGNKYAPTDYGQQPYHYRPFTLTEAIIKSDNVVSVKLNQQIGPSILVEYAQKLGIKSTLKPNLSLALGTSEVTPLEMASAYGAFANQGQIAKPLYIIKITDQDGRVLEENSVQLQYALAPHAAFIVTDMLRGVLQPGGTAEKVGSIVKRPAAGKTGTTQDYRDVWFVGYTPELSTAIFIGYDKPKSTGMTGGSLAAPIWGDFTNKALAAKEIKDFVQPANTIKVTICADTGLLATPLSESTFQVSFLKGTEPTTECPNHSTAWPFGNWFWTRPEGTL